MPRDANEPKATRRDFLRIAGVSGPAAVAATVVGSKAGAAERETPGAGAELMRDTAHTRAYYDSARL